MLIVFPILTSPRSRPPFETLPCLIQLPQKHFFWPPFAPKHWPPHPDPLALQPYFVTTITERYMYGSHKHPQPDNWPHSDDVHKALSSPINLSLPGCHFWAIS